ncbi:MAG: N-6 DNA methylase [Caldilineaceae bacterium]|nr:N-6 DNA methylase [Caldilineaceae bacterium]
MSERKTEGFVRRHFDQYTSEVEVEEQQSDRPHIRRLLAKASKSGGGGPGKPEFLVHFGSEPDLIGVVECKALPLQHQSDTLDRPIECAVDGALHYAKHLSKGCNVLAIGVSGTSQATLRVSHFLHFKDTDEASPILDDRLLPPGDYLLAYRGSEGKYRQDYEALQEFIRNLNERFQAHKVAESRRALLISSVLIALERSAFRNSYRSEHDPRALAESVVDTAVRQLQEAGVRKAEHVEVLRLEFGFLKTTPVLSADASELRQVITDIDEEVNSFTRNHEFRDVLGEAYIEFLRYSNSDKGLGIVLTPPHITELFAELARPTVDSVVYDNCAGTGGFLVSAMRAMVAAAKGDSAMEDNIKSGNLFGVEMQPNIYPLAVSNMYIHQDGKSNVELGDCFSDAIVSWIRRRRPTIGLLNPPFKTERDDTEELEFVLNNLSCLQSGGTCVAIVPMQIALATTGDVRLLKQQLLARHTVEAVLSMPDELFFNSDVNVVTCVLVLTAHRPHPGNKEVFFGYFKDDGFEKRRIGGRCDAEGRWQDIKTAWVDYFTNRTAVSGLSVCAPIGLDTEWCAEEHMETDHLSFRDEDFDRTLHDYAIYLFSSRRIQEATADALCPDRTTGLHERDWSPVKVADLFDVTGTRTTPLRVLKKLVGNELSPYVSTSTSNNGVRGEYPHRTEAGGCLTVDSAVCGYCAYQHWPFSASDHVEKLLPQFDCDPLVALFFVAVVNREQYRYNYGRKCSQTRLRRSRIWLPMTPDGEPDYDFIRQYMRERRYSSNLKELQP